MKNKELIYEEHSKLKDELRDLKKCQITFLTFSVTATAIILGFIVKLSPSDTQGVFYLSPLIVLLPAWCVFFDKATTITRIVGYYRILEMLILEKCSANNFVGWENALSGIRNAGSEELEIKKCAVKKLNTKEWLNFFNVFTFRKQPHRYWALVFSIFFWLSLLCLFLFLIYNPIEEPFMLLFAIFIASLILYITFINLNLVFELIYGYHSYDANEYFWRKYLDLECNKN